MQPHPETVVRDPTQCLLRRFAAVALDSAIVLVPVMVIARIAGVWRPLPGGGIAYTWGWPGIVALWALGVAYWTFFESRWVGSTPGKRLLRVRVVSMADGTPPRLGPTLARNACRIVDQFICPLVGPLLIWTTYGHRRLGDHAARTIVVREAAVRATPTPPEPL